MPGLALLFLIAYLLIVTIAAVVIILQIVRPRRKTFAIALAQGHPTHPSDIGLQAQDASFSLPDNHTTPGWVITGKQADGPTILVLHGHRDSIHGALRFAEQLARYAGHVVVFDWPGHGECTAKWMTCGKREPADAIAVLDGLPEELRNKPIVLFGYSLGGQIAIKTAAEHPRFDAVIIDGAYRHWDTPVRVRLKELKVPPIPKMQLVGLVFHLTGLIRNFDRARFAQRIEVPLLVLHGTDDRLCPIDEAKQIAEAATNSTFVPIEGARHNKLFVKDAEKYHDALGALFEQLHHANV